MVEQSRKSSATDALTEEYAEWNREQGLALGSADEHMFDSAITKEQRKWLHNFVDRWEEAERFDRDAPVTWIEGPYGHAYFWRDDVLVAAPLYSSRPWAPIDLDPGVQTTVQDLAEPLNAEQLAAVAVGLKVAALIPERRVRILACTEFSWEAERGKCAAWLVTVEAKGGTVIFDPYASECGRFRIDPFTEYGISPDAARLMSQHNQVQL